MRIISTAPGGLRDARVIFLPPAFTFSDVLPNGYNIVYNERVRNRYEPI